MFKEGDLVKYRWDKVVGKVLGPTTEDHASYTAGFDSNVELPELDDHGMQVMKGDDDWYCRHCDELTEECMCDE